MKILLKFTFFNFVLWLCGYGLFVGNVLLKTPEDTGRKTDAIVVLTGGNDRVTTGLLLLAEGAANNLFISGVNEEVTYDEVRALIPAEKSLPDCCITLGYDAKTTEQNAEEVAKWIAAQEQGIASIRLVTSHYHADRALIELRQTLGDIDIVIHPIAHIDDGVAHQKFWRLTFEEYNKILYRFVQISYLKLKIKA